MGLRGCQENPGTEFYRWSRTVRVNRGLSKQERSGFSLTTAGALSVMIETTIQINPSRKQQTEGGKKMIVTFYLCPRCFEPADEPLPCPKCGGRRVTCRPGAADDPIRKPPVAASGELRNRAPVWWLRATGAPGRQTKIAR
jgi:hypothetical protein